MDPYAEEDFKDPFVDYPYVRVFDRQAERIPSPAARLFTTGLTTVGHVVPISAIVIFLREIFASTKQIFGDDVFTSKVPRLLKLTCQVGLSVVASQAVWHGGKYMWHNALVYKLRLQKGTLNDIEQRLGKLRDVYSREPLPVMGVKKVFNCTPKHMVSLMEKRWRCCSIQHEILRTELSLSASQGYILWSVPQDTQDAIKQLGAAVRRLDMDVEFTPPEVLQERLEKGEILHQELRAEEERKKRLERRLMPPPWDADVDWNQFIANPYEYL